MTYQRLAIAHPKTSDQASLTASSEASASTGIEQLQGMQPKEPWQADTLSGLYFEADLGAGSVSWNFLALLFHNAGDGDTWRIRTADTQPNLTAAPTYDSAAVEMWPSAGADDDAYLETLEYTHSLLWLGDSGHRSERWVRVDLAISSPKLPSGYSGDPYFQAGRLYVSDAYRPPYDKDQGSTFTQKERGGKRTTTFNGGLRTRKGTVFKEKNFNVGFLTRVQNLAEPWVISELRGETSDILVVEDPAEVNANLVKLTFYGLASAVSSKHDKPDVYGRRYKVETFVG